MPEIVLRKKNRVWRHVFSYPAGVLLFYPVAIALVMFAYTGAVPFKNDDAALARVLPSLWLTSLLLTPLAVPFLMHLRHSDGLDPAKVMIGFAKVLGFTAVAMLLTLLYERTAGAVRAAVMFHVFLLGFQVLLAGLFVFMRGLGASGSLSQSLSSIVGFLMISSAAFANPALEYAGDVHRGMVIMGAVWSNPLVVAAHSFLGLDVFRMQPLYGFSRLADYPFHYPMWKMVFAAYAATGGVLAATGAAFRLLFHVLPKSMRLKRQERAAEIRRLEADARQANVPAPLPLPSFPQSDYDHSASAGQAVPQEQPLAMSFDDDEEQHHQPEGMSLGALQLESEQQASQLAMQGWTDGRQAEEASPEPSKPEASWLDNASPRSAMKTRVFEKDSDEQGRSDQEEPASEFVPDSEGAGSSEQPQDSDDGISSIANLMAALDDVDAKTAAGDGSYAEEEQPGELAALETGLPEDFIAQPVSPEDSGPSPDSEEQTGEEFIDAEGQEEGQEPERRERASGPHLLSLWERSPSGEQDKEPPGSMDEPFRGFSDHEQPEEERQAIGHSFEIAKELQPGQPALPEHEEEEAAEIEAELEAQIESETVPDDETSAAADAGSAGDAEQAEDLPAQSEKPAFGLGWLDEAVPKKQPAAPTEHERKDTVRMQRRSTSIFSEMRSRLDSSKTGRLEKKNEDEEQDPPQSRFLRLDSEEEESGSS